MIGSASRAAKMVIQMIATRAPNTPHRQQQQQFNTFIHAFLY
jgi:hypothetical protein